MTADGVPVIADFEVAKQLGVDRESAVTVTSTLTGAAGTVGYMAPEVGASTPRPAFPRLAPCYRTPVYPRLCAEDSHPADT